ncbi:MAG: T9SS type A sorting domain-containing protein [Candidatus Eisenbacteria bacterium]|nr:T9SS type A sorting domain-containing protein [Candidatus Eisenbacteria bacterium]
MHRRIAPGTVVTALITLTRYSITKRRNKLPVPAVKAVLSAFEWLPPLARVAAVLGCLLSGTAFGQAELATNIHGGGSSPLQTAGLGDTVYIAALNNAGPGFRVYQFDDVTDQGEPVPGLPPMSAVRALVGLETRVVCVGTPVGGTDQGIWALDGSSATLLRMAPENSWGFSALDLNGGILFTSVDATYGFELWFSDGTPGGTNLVLDINPGGDSVPFFGAIVDGVAFFTADDGTHGRELWKTDGTTGGTQLVKDLLSGSGSSSPLFLTAFQDMLLFQAFNDLYRSDGTDAGTVLVSPIADIGTGMLATASWTYFPGYDSATGNELYRTDGTVVELVADIVPGPESSFPAELTRIGNQFCFVTRGLDDQLWRSDGTEGGTTLVADLAVDPEEFQLAGLYEHDGAVYFFASEPAGDWSESELWRSEGDLASTVKLEVYPGDLGSLPRNFVSAGDHLYFTAFDGTDTGRELWRAANTDLSPELAFDIVTERSSSPTDFLRVDESIFFAATEPYYGRTVFRMYLDDDPLGASRKASQETPGDDIILGTSEFVVDSESTLDDLYVTTNVDGFGLEPVVATTYRIYPIDVNPGPDGSDPSDLVFVGGSLFFVAEVPTTGGYGVYVWEPSGGLGNGDLTLLQDFGANRPHSLLPFTDGVLFIGTDPGHGTELWRASVSGASRVADIHPGAGSSDPADLTIMDDRVYFSAFHPDSGRELWCTDGTGAGTHLVEDVNAGVSDSNPQDLTDGYPSLYFSANTPGSGRELYKATEAGAVPIEEVVPGPGSADPRELAYASSRLFFSADDGSGVGREPWVSNGVSVNLVADLQPGPGSSTPTEFGGHLGAVYFLADDGASGRELWRYSGSLLNVSDSIAPGPASSFVGERVSTSDGRYVFVAEEAEYGREFWYVTDAGGPSDAPVVPVRVGDRLALRAGPNPFGDHLDLRFELPRAGVVRTSLLDASGRVVAEQSLGRQEAGSHSVRWSLAAEQSRIPGGVYFLRIVAGTETSVRKVLRVR